MSLNGVVGTAGRNDSTRPAQCHRQDVMDGLKQFKCNVPIPLSLLASIYNEEQIDELLSGRYNIIFLLSSKPAVIKLDVP